MFDGMDSRFDPQQQLGAIRTGDVRVLARAITLVENRNPEAIPVLQAAFPYTGRAKKIGLAGSPGVGKSTLAGRLAQAYREQGFQVAILAVDPSSPFGGGAMLGDRIRMQGQAGIYIRSMATRGHLGGLASTTVEVIDLLDAAGFDRILVESVGAGQDEVEIAFTVDAQLLLTAPGLGDSVQLLKAGLNEVADIFVVNKSDGPGVEWVAEDIRTGLELASRRDGWRVPVVFTNASAGTGTSSLLELIEAYLKFLEQTGNHRTSSIQQWQMRILHAVRDAIDRRLISEDLRSRIAGYAFQVVNANANPYELVQSLLAEMMASGRNADVGVSR